VLSIVDLESKNGVFVSDVRVRAAEIFPGVNLRLARVRLALRPAFGTAQPKAAPLRGLVGNSAPMLRLSARVRRLAKLPVPVLIRGESGTGKELVAKAIHELSGRTGAFTAINAASLSRELGESELFGHKRGAFTGATADRVGAFREAMGGTLFIDELGSLAGDVQAKLLRAVEEGSVRPIGQDCAVSVDVRLVAATCDGLEEAVAKGQFRRDLYERLAVSVVRVPALRDRLEDLPLLAEHLLRHSGFSAGRLSSGGLAALRGQPLTGNVRELRSLLVLAAVAACDDPPGAEELVIEARHILTAVSERSGKVYGLSAAEAAMALNECGGNASAAARRLRVPRSTLRDLLRRGRAA
jgi:DNA-binding NtrC family response regulator